MAVKKDDDKIAELEESIMMARRHVSVGDVWRHVRSGKRYIILDIVVIEKTLKLAVIYVAAHNGTVKWSRPMAEFLDGRFVRLQQ